MSQSGSLRVGLVGAGNCASSFVQGLGFYGEAQPNEPSPGLMHADLGGYHVRDIEIVSVFDVTAAKVGRDVSDALMAPPNNTHVFAPLKPLGIEVKRGPTLDGLGTYLRQDVDEAEAPVVDVAEDFDAAGPTCWFPICP